MRLLLDTHALLWFLEGDSRMGSKARTIVADRSNDAFVSVVSFWEVAIKIRIGKLTADLGLVMANSVQAGFQTLDVRLEHIAVVPALPTIAGHRDPFDHLLIAQAKVEGLTFVSDDPNARRYAVSVMRCRR